MWGFIPSSALRAPSPRKRGEGQQISKLRACCPSPRLRGEGGRRPGEGRSRATLTILNDHPEHLEGRTPSSASRGAEPRVPRGARTRASAPPPPRCSDSNTAVPRMGRAAGQPSHYTSPMRKLLALLLFSTHALAASRDPVVARHAMVASTSEIASRVGVDVMKKGGNAVDAAVAVALALAVTWPAAGNLGGGGFMLIGNADGTSEAIDYRER